MKNLRRGGSWRTWARSRGLGVSVVCGCVAGALDGPAQTRDSLAGEKAAQALRESLAEEDYNLRWGPWRFQTEASFAASYSDNVFLSEDDRSDDIILNPEITLGGLWPITDINTLRLSLGVGYEWYLDNTDLNSDAPLVNPDSELVFHVFAGDFHFRLREKFSYQESLFHHTATGGTDRFFNFNDVGKFRRWDNLIGLEAVWDLNDLILRAGYDHENFMPVTSQFDYLERASEWFTTSAAFQIADEIQTGLEAQASLHNFEDETVLTDHWRARTGPFLEYTSEMKISLRTGGGYETASFDDGADDSDFDSYYAYVSARQETRLFTHSLAAGREHLLGDNADNLRLTRLRYAISSPIMEHVDLGGHVSMNFAKEFGGGFSESFTYYRAGVGIGYQFHKYWRTDLGYDFFLKDSDLPDRDFYRNRATWQVAFIF